MTQENNRITASEGMTFVRIHDGFEMGEEIYLGIDYSTGEPREDLPEYYREELITNNNN
jgi:hypothetical protein